MKVRLVFRLLIIVLSGAALYIAYRFLSRYSLSDIMRSFGDLPFSSLALAAILMALSYATLTMFDALALNYLGKPLPYRKIALASFTSLSIGHNVGVAALSSGAVRYRFYSQWGLSALEVGKLIAFCGVTVALGQVTLAGLALAIQPDRLAGWMGVGLLTARLAGCAFLLVAAAYIGLCLAIRRSFKLWRWTFTLPSGKIACGQVVVGALNYLFVGGCLYQLVSVANDVVFLEAAGAFVMANLLAVIAHVPGGLGVIEATLAFILQSSSIGALIAFRVIYFFLPLPFGLALLASSGLLLKDESGPGDNESRSRRLSAESHP